MRLKVLFTVVACACGGGDAQPRTEIAATATVAPPPVPTATAEATATAAPSATASDQEENAATNADAGALAALLADAGPIGFVRLEPIDGGEPWGPEPSGAGGGTSGTVFVRGRSTSRPHITMRQGTSTVNGRLPPEVILRIVRQHYGMFRACYEHGLRANPTLEGRVAVRFVIAASGDVREARDGGSDLASTDVRECVTSAFKRLQFPKPESGVVTVVYPIIFGVR